MKISIVTAVYNAVGTIEENVLSVAEQAHVDREHIVIDGGSTDGTMEVIMRHRDKLSHIVSEPDHGVYHAMNKGLALASGDVVAFLNADDIYVSERVLSRVAGILADTSVDACYADLYFVAQNDPSRVVRRLYSRPYREGLFRWGWMPPHPTLFVRKELLDELGGFDQQFKLQSDFDLAIRLFHAHRIKSVYVHETWVRMRMGGISNRSWRHVLRGNREAKMACSKNGIRSAPFFVIRKIASRIPQFRYGQRA